MFDPSIGRWMQEDPVRFLAGDVNYDRYVGNNSTNETDPTGLWTKVGVTRYLTRSKIGRITLEALRAKVAKVVQVEYIRSFYRELEPDGKKYGPLQWDSVEGNHIGGVIRLLEKFDDLFAALSIIHEMTHAIYFGAKDGTKEFAVFKDRVTKLKLGYDHSYINISKSDLLNLSTATLREKNPEDAVFDAVATQVAKMSGQRMTTLTAKEQLKVRKEFPAFRNEVMFLIENPELIAVLKPERVFKGFSDKITDLVKLRQEGGAGFLYLKPDPIIDEIAGGYVWKYRQRAAAAKPPPMGGKAPLSYCDPDGNQIPNDRWFYGKETTMDF